MGMNFTTLTVAIIFMSMFALAIGAFMVDLSSNYQVPINQSYTNTYQKLNEITNITNEINAEVIGDSSTSSTSSEALFQQGQSAVLLSFGGIGLIGAILQDGAEVIGLPYWFIGGILAIIIVILSFLLFGVFTRAFQKL